jgi:hypothetical protein
MFPRNRPVFVWPSRLNHQVAVSKLIRARKVLPYKSPRDRSLNVMRYRMRLFIHVVAAEGRLITGHRQCEDQENCVSLWLPFTKRPFQRVSSPAVLVVADLFHPVDDLTVELFLNGDMRHGRGRRSTMPMLLARQEPDHIAGMDLFNRTALALHPTATRCDYEDLTQRMGVPRGASTRLERNACAYRASWSVCLEQGINACRAGKIFGRSFDGGL